ncbi:MAG: hypothetical protein ABIP39_12750 [Polyangiaceae bacterium]
MSTNRKGFVASQEGAVMIMGVFMALALIGVMWFLLGIGASVVFREKMQEGADSGVFSSAAVHARSMNFIVAINLVMFALAAFWVVLCITYTAMVIVSIYTWIVGIVSCILGCEALGAAENVEQVKERVGQLKDQYRTFLSAALPSLSAVQSGVAMSADIAAAGVSAGQIAETTGEFGLAASADLPGDAGPTAIGGRLGLPVENEESGKLCRHSAEWAMGYLQTLIAKNPAVKKLLSLSATERSVIATGLMLNPTARALFTLMNDAGNEIRNLTADALQLTYCSDDFWKKAGPKRMWRSEKSAMEKNASDWMQVYSVVLPTGLDDNRAEHQLGVSHLDNTKNATVPFMFFYAQAEYFLDCEGKWDSGSCNAISDSVKDTGIDASMYRLEWRTRLVRVHTPKKLPGAKLVNAFNTVLAQVGGLKKAQNNSPAVQGALGALPPQVLAFLNEVPSANFH